MAATVPTGRIRATRAGGRGRTPLAVETRAGAAGALFAAFFLGSPAAAQVEAPSPPSSSPPSASAGPTPGGPAQVGLPGRGSQGWGFPGPEASGSGFSPESRSRLGTAGFPFNAVGAPPAGPAGAPARAWTIVPSIAVEGTYNDNLFFTQRNKRDDFITTITPGLFLNVDTARLQGTMNYAPGINLYAHNTDQNSVTLNGNGQFLATLLPEFLFFQARGSSFVQPVGGSLTPQTQDQTGRGDLVQTTTFSLSPYATYRFGGTATAFLGYVYSYVDQSSAANNPRSGQLNDQLQSRFGSSQYTSNQAYGLLRTGEDFGRYAAQGSVSGTWYEGNGLYDGAYRNIALLENRYAITQTIAGLVEIGYERQKFNTIPVTEIDDVVWAFGVRLTPNPDSLIIAKYGHRNGYNSFYLNGSLAVGVRTQIFATYQDTLTTSALSAGDLLSTTSVDALGNPIDTQTGAPVLPSLAVTNLNPGVLYRQKQGTAAISQSWPRDTIRLGLTYTENTPFAATQSTSAVVGGIAAGLSTETTSLGLSWSHELTPYMNLITFGEYGISTNTVQNVSNDSNNATAGIALVRELAPGLAGTLSYRFNWRDGGVSRTGQLQSDEATQNLITAGLRQSF